MIFWGEEIDELFYGFPSFFRLMEKKLKNSFKAKDLINFENLTFEDFRIQRKKVKQFFSKNFPNYSNIFFKNKSLFFVTFFKNLKNNFFALIV